jgi:hypothetical protein
MYQFMVSHLHNGGVPSGFLLGATHQNKMAVCEMAPSRKSLFANEVMLPDAKREVIVKRNYHVQYGISFYFSH